jgi:hypothetical protein
LWEGGGKAEAKKVLAHTAPEPEQSGQMMPLIFLRSGQMMDLSQLPFPTADPTSEVNSYKVHDSTFIQKSGFWRG